MADSRQSEAGGRTVEGQATLRGLGGRPTKPTPELAFKVYECLRSGASFTATCRVVGISKEVFRRWRLPCTDEAPDHEHSPACLHVIERFERRDGQLVGTGEFVAFVVLVEHALGAHEARLAFLITKAAEKDWRAALELLRRATPKTGTFPSAPNLSLAQLASMLSPPASG